MPSNVQSHGDTQAHSDIEQRDDGSAMNRQDTRIHLTEVKKVLEGAKFPSDKVELVEYAKQKQAPRQILDTLEQLLTSEFGSPNAEHMPKYNSIDELIREIEKVERTD